MGICKFCKKKLGFLEGYEDFDGEYCRTCFDDMQENPEKYKKLIERESMKEKTKKISKNTEKGKSKKTKEPLTESQQIIQLLKIIVVLLLFYYLSRSF